MITFREFTTGSLIMTPFIALVVAIGSPHRYLADHPPTPDRIADAGMVVDAGSVPGRERMSPMDKELTGGALSIRPTRPLEPGVAAVAPAAHSISKRSIAKRMASRSKGAMHGTVAAARSVAEPIRVGQETRVWWLELDP